MKLSLCMIVKNEEDVLGRCLTGVYKLFDEIIIIDTGSTDKTKEIAHQFTKKVYDFVWVDDFSAARNYSFSKATGDYIMWLDADDVITEENFQKLMQLKTTLNGAVDIYMLKYAINFNELGKSSFVYYRERIIKNDKTFFWSDPIHEVITPHGVVKHEDIEIHHKKIKTAPSDRNLKIYEKYLSRGNTLKPRQMFYYARELFYNAKYELAIQTFTEFLNNNLGWLENKIEACLILSKCYLNLKQHNNALKVLFSSFAYDAPRAEILCELSGILMHLKKYNLAIYWLKQTLKTKINIQSGAFVLPDCYGLIPHLQLCVCYYNLNKLKLSEKHNNIAYSINPNNLSVQINKKLFEQLREKGKI